MAVLEGFSKKSIRKWWSVINIHDKKIKGGEIK